MRVHACSCGTHVNYSYLPTTFDFTHVSMTHSKCEPNAKATIFHSRPIPRITDGNVKRLKRMESHAPRSQAT